MSALPIRLPQTPSFAGRRRWLKPLLVLAVSGIALSGCHYYHDDGIYDGGLYPYDDGSDYVSPYSNGYFGPYFLGDQDRFSDDLRGDDLRGDNHLGGDLRGGDVQDDPSLGFDDDEGDDH
jgi:hypothetical protein